MKSQIILFMNSSSSNNTDGFNSIFYKFEKQYLLEYQNNTTTNIIINVQ